MNCLKASRSALRDLEYDLQAQTLDSVLHEVSGLLPEDRVESESRDHDAEAADFRQFR